uniref:Fe2OG dioxygenase domain-containing protein n=1 Tax=Brassica campestris TaxID=3711 RepID=M4DAK2_BRACM
MERFASESEALAHTLAEVLAEKLERKSNFFKENCVRNTCYVRMNRYPPCPKPSEVYGLMPHTDSDFLTILYQDQVGGLQLIKDNRWVAVKPNPRALIINIGDLFQAWSNGMYKSVEHRVMTNPTVERFSTAYFLCPSYDAVIECSGDCPSYRNFSFREFRQQVQDDVKKLGYKVGLPSSHKEVGDTHSTTRKKEVPSLKSEGEGIPALFVRGAPEQIWIKVRNDGIRETIKNMHTKSRARIQVVLSIYDLK